MQADEPLDFNSAGPHESSAQAKIKQKTRQQRAQARIKRKKRAPGRPRPRPARVSNKNKKKAGASNENAKKGASNARLPCSPMQNHQTAKKNAAGRSRTRALPAQLPGTRRAGQSAE